MRTIIFVNARIEADNLDDFLFNMSLPVASIHSDRTQKEREIALDAFREGRAPILVATSVAARGIDIKDVMHVINYDLPSIDHGGIEEYTHRNGFSSPPPLGASSEWLAQLTSTQAAPGALGFEGSRRLFLPKRTCPWRMFWCAHF